MHRWHARKAARTAEPLPFLSPPEPRTIGSIDRGQELLAGTFLFSGHLVEGTNRSIWDVAGDNRAVADELQGFLWLDDLAALGTDEAREKGQLWVFDWIQRYGQGRGPGWTPELTGRRLVRWINHALFVLRGQPSENLETFHRSLGAQAVFLNRRWPVMQTGLPRFEALTGVIYANLLLDGLADQTGPAVAALADDCARYIQRDGSIENRNPEELLEILTLLNITVEALREANHDIPQHLLDAVTPIVPVLRALRHADGNLARFHGGGRGREGQLDAALADARVRDLPKPGLQMGYLRLSGGRTSLIADAAAPPTGAASANAHASTLGFELTSGRRPLIVNCGSGRRFGNDWRRASRATPSHSTLTIGDISSAHLSKANRGSDRQEWLQEAPERVYFGISEADGVRRAEMSHDGYRHSHGLTHARILDLSVDGRTLEGEDLLATLDPEDERLFGHKITRDGQSVLHYTIRFHLHPDVGAERNRDDEIKLALPSGEDWVFTHDGTAKMSLAPSVYLELGQLEPTPSQQMVLSGRTMSYATRIRWSLAKAPDTPDVIRDLTDLADVTE